MAPSAPSPEEVGRAVGGFLGLPPLGQADLGHIAAAAAITAVIVVLARFLRTRLRRWLDRVVAPRFDVTQPRFVLTSRALAAVVAALAAVALMTLAAEAYPWPPYSQLVFDLGISIGVAIAAWRLASLFKLSTSAALAVAIVSGSLVLTDRYEQLGWVQRSLDNLAVSLGETRVSLFDLLTGAFAAIVLYALVRVAMRGARAFIRSRRNLDVTQSLLAEKIAAIVIIVMAAFVAIDMLGIDTTALSVFSGTVGLGLGFGLQKIFSNLVSGIILLMDRSIKPGDVIMVGEAVGKVNRIGTRAVSVITRDGKEYLVPNELLMTERVENWNYTSRDVRIRMSVTVDSDSDIDVVEGLMKEAALASRRVLKDPAPVVWITDLNDVGIKLELRFWIHDPEDGLGNVQGEIYKTLISSFRRHEIVLPNPTRNISIRETPTISVRRVEEP